MIESRSDAASPRPSSPRRRRGGAVPLLLAVLALLVFAVGSTVGFGRFIDKFTEDKGDFDGPPGAERVVKIEPGTSLRAMGDQLESAGVVRSDGAFVSAARANPRSRNIGPGTYRMAETLPAIEALDRLLDPKFRILARVVIPEGFTVTEILAKLAAETKIPAEKFTEVLADPAAYGLPDWANAPAEHLAEGFLFPATYDLEPEDTATSVLTQFTKRFHRAAIETGLGNGFPPENMTPFQVLTVASLVQAEAKRAEDMPKVARVIYNRLAKGMRLQFDTTVLYAAGGARSVTTTADQRDVDSPYNTYRVTGLPAGPICSPGEAAIRAALAPADGTWLYFVAINPDTGETRFANDAAGHAANVELFRQWLREHPDRT